MEGHHPPHHHPHQLHPQVSHLQYGGAVSVDASVGGGSGVGDRFPQWSIQETRDFLIIRAELDPTFMQTKRNKLLWEIIASKMKEKGYNRSAEQCKCKWKNLVTRYKGCETMEPEGMRQQFPYYNELQTIFNARMQRMLWMEAEGGSSTGGSKKKAAMALSSDEEEENEESEGEAKSGRKKRKVKGGGGSGSGVANSLREILEEFMKQQMQMEAQWMKAVEAREEERRVKEMEWRRTMEALENERVMMERRWREREEQRRAREEARAEKRDTLITALLNKLRREDL
ncbi:trihelix transcription factor GT-3b-like [Ipomoea triloba]|uniref:trihelix transcription factor GT-3b-like n=1 Tax=Ipomoea triloba TaxID=35885 RepID=UPI00125E6F79|nr:trihelix transcription factor GT-3b-like [Ipomoea triloba]